MIDYAVTLWRFSFEGQRYIKVAKSPISPPLAFPFIITSSGISLISDNGIEVKGPEIHSIHCQGQLLSLRRFSNFFLGFSIHCKELQAIFG